MKRLHTLPHRYLFPISPVRYHTTKTHFGHTPAPERRPRYP